MITERKTIQETVYRLKVDSDGNLSLCRRKEIRVLDISYDIHRPYGNKTKHLVDRTVGPSNLYQLNPTTAEELSKYREYEIPSFVLKLDGKLYHAEIPEKMDLVSAELLGPHLCTLSKCECSRMVASPDSLGGCAKVRDVHKRIENYPWIKTGYETFATKHDIFAVVRCLHYRCISPQEKLSPLDVYNRHLQMAQLALGDVETFEDVNNRIEENIRNGGFNNIF